MATTTILTPEELREHNVKWVRERLERDCYAKITPNLLRLVVAAVVDGDWGLDDVTSYSVDLCQYFASEKLTITLWVNRGCIHSSRLSRTTTIAEARKIIDAEAWLTADRPPL